MALEDPAIAAGVARLRARLEQADRSEASVIGWKVGWNDQSARLRLGVRTGVVGCLLRDSTGRFDRWPIHSLELPLVEVEVACLVGSHITPASDDDAVRAAVTAAAPAIEVLDVSSHRAEDAIADNVWHVAASLGEWSAWPTEGPLRGWSAKGERDPRPLPGLEHFEHDLPEAIRFVAAGAAAFGRSLLPGHVVLCGNLARSPIPVAPGDLVTAGIDGLGAVSLALT